MESELKSAVTKRQKMSTDHPGHSSSSGSTSKEIKRFLHRPPTFYSEHSSRKWFVDKTLFIKKILDKSCSVLITAPKRFGKTANLQMLMSFIEIQTDENGKPIELEMDGTELKKEQRSPNFHLFADKKIFQHKDIFINHFGQNPVIYVDFELTLVVGSYKEFLGKLREAISEAFRDHGYLQKSENYYGETTFNKYIDWGWHDSVIECDLITALALLSEILYKHFNRQVYVLIDHFDAPLFNIIASERIGKSEEASHIARCVKAFISELLNNKCVKATVLTGRHNAKQILLPDDIEHIVALQSDDFYPFYGFTEEEVKKLLGDHGHCENFDKIKKWYNGYGKKLHNGGHEIYDNVSITRSLHSSEFHDYWSDSGLQCFEKLMERDKIRDKFSDLLNKKIVTIQPQVLAIESYITLCHMLHNPKYTTIRDIEVDLFFQWLYECGYLNVVEERHNELDLEVPNEMICWEILSNGFGKFSVPTWFNLEEQTIERFAQVFQHMIENKTEASFVDLANCTNDLFTARLPRNQFELHILLYNILRCYGERITIASKSRASVRRQDRCDIVAITNRGWEEEKSGILLELKFGAGTGSQNALKQIVDQSYYRDLEGKQIANKILIGLHVAEDGKTTITYLEKSMDESDGKTSASDETWDVYKCLTVSSS